MFLPVTKDLPVNTDAIAFIRRAQLVDEFNKPKEPAEYEYQIILQNGHVLQVLDDVATSAFKQFYAEVNNTDTLRSIKP